MKEVSPSVSDDESEEHEEDLINNFNEESDHSDGDLGDSDSGDSDRGDSDSDDIDPDDSGWLWLSSCRRFTPQDARTMGLRAGPHRLAIKYTDTRKDCSKIVLMEPKAFQYLLKKQEDIESEKAASNDKDNGTNENSKSKEKSDSETDSKIGIEKKKLEQALIFLLPNQTEKKYPQFGEA